MLFYMIIVFIFIFLRSRNCKDSFGYTATAKCSKLFFRQGKNSLSDWREGNSCTKRGKEFSTTTSSPKSDCPFVQSCSILVLITLLLHLSVLLSKQDSKFACARILWPFWILHKAEAEHHCLRLFICSLNKNTGSKEVFKCWERH